MKTPKAVNSDLLQKMQFLGKFRRLLHSLSLMVHRKGRRFTITTKNRLALIFSFYIFAFIAIISFIFITILRFNLVYEIKKGVSEETAEIVRNHIIIIDGRVEFVPDTRGINLKEELSEYDFSALFLDKDINYIAGFGVFEFYRNGDKKAVETLVKLANETQKTNFPQDTTLTWRTKSIFVYSVPLKKENETFGFALIAKPMDGVHSVVASTYLIISGLLIFGLLGSVTISFWFVKKALRPVRNLSYLIDKIDLTKLDSYISLEGHPLDELVILSKKFNEMLVRLKTMSELQKDFISNASHELQTPLAKSISTIDVLTYKHPQLTQELKLVRADLFDISGLINELLNLAKLNKEIEKHADFIKITDLAKKITRRFASDLKAKKLTLITKIKNQLTVYFPIKYAEVIFSNILSNAIKYSKNGTKIIIKGYKNMEGHVILKIKDEGVGMDKDEIKSIYDRFFRGSGTKLGGGHGIGLTLVKQICDLYGVAINIKSQKGKGTEVELVFS